MLNRDEEQNSRVIEARDEAGTSDSDKTEVVTELRDFSNNDTDNDVDIPSDNIDTVTAFGRKRNFLQNMWLLLHEILESYMTYY